MSNKMLIDATHPEETRVVVLRGNRVEEFDFEAADRQQLRGNIYLAKVTRVEPSLQAAFVDYGGNRHGFLAFSEIHPDYYQIPFADRQALLQEQAREDEEEAAEEEAAETAAEETAEAAEAAEAAPLETGEPASVAEETSSAETSEAFEPRGESEADESGEAEHDDTVESVGAEDAMEEVPERRKPRPRQYKIQEVIKRRQVLLVQVVKEERGNKGAALTTYLSLAGRYSVLMPNTGRGGGISRKITNPADRKRLKAIAGELEVPEGMGVILRTAGANRTKAEVKRDFEYLLRLWENVRELTLRSSAPKLVYEEGSLIKRSIRDLYSREIDQVVVAGEDAYREAKEFMRMLMPSHARHVQLYREDTPVFSRNGVEAQLDAMFSPQVTLRSGGYIVINQTEALVSIDVNSGRSTREHSIEDTALNTNMEAAEEIARQLRLRDLAGLIVIDFIDMEEKRNNRSVERKLKDCLRADRARIQVGRISHFGLMEMSRQRIRTGVLESSTVSCPHCRGTGQVRSISSLSLQILRALEDQLLRNSGHHLYVRTRPEVALYVLNQKRRHLAQLEARFGLAITISGEAPESGLGFSVERGDPVENRPERLEHISTSVLPDLSEAAEPLEDEAEDVSREEDREEESAAESPERRRSRRRRRRGNGEDRHERGVERPDHYHAGGVEEVEAEEEADVEELGAGESRPAGGTDEESQDARRRRRGRRGGRRRGGRREPGEFAGNGRPPGQLAAAEPAFAPPDMGAEQPSGTDEGPEEPRSAPYDSAWSESAETETVAENPAAELDRYADIERADEPPAGDGHAAEVAALEEAAERSEETQPVAGHAAEQQEQQSAERAEEPAPAEPAQALPVAPPPAPVPPPVEDDRPKRSGWWNRKSFF